MKTEIKAPEIGESINEVTIGKWLVQNGDFVNVDDILCEIESEKATLEIVAEQSGKIEILIPEGQTVAIGTPIALIEGNEPSEKQTTDSAKKQAEPQKQILPQANEKNTPKLKITPLAKKIMEEKKIDPSLLTKISATERVTKEKLETLIQKLDHPQQKETSSKEPAFPAHETTKKRTERRERMSSLRKTISEHLLKARQSTAMLTTFNEVDMSEVINLRQQYRSLFEQKYGVKLGFMSFFVKAAAQALQEFPIVNAQIDGDEIVYHDYVDIGIAVSTDRGLVVPVIRDVQNLSLGQIEQEVARLAQAARNRKLSIQEMKGGTFSITNGGVFGSLLSTPLINLPQSAILGMHNIQQRPIAMDGQVVVRPMMYLALSYDHRLIDGKESVQFLIRIKELIEQPVRLLLHV